MNNLILKKFNSININDPFFDTLKTDYAEFEDWFMKKGDKEAYVMYENNKLEGFLYIKTEDGPVTDVEPSISKSSILKIGTFKINPHGTRLGERFIKKALDIAVDQDVDACYVTIFEKHTALLDLLMKYGFEEYGIKNSKNGTELVLLKDMKSVHGCPLKDYPFIDSRYGNKYILSVYPKYHTNLFPDSILKNETYDILKDVSHTNSIHKVYVANMPDIAFLKRGDLLVIYRTTDQSGRAEYRSVATSICTVEEVYHQSAFPRFSDFYDYASKYSVFDRGDLFHWYQKGGCYTIKMAYNAALSKRLIRKKLADECDLDRGGYWGLMKISNHSFDKIVELGGVNESLIIN